MTDTIVSNAPAPAESAPAAAAPAPAAPAAADLEKQIADLREEAAESKRAAQFWAERAQTPAAPAQSAAAEPEDDDTDVLEAITSNGTKGFEDLAAKRGFIKRNEVEQMIEQRAASLTREQELLSQYPELKDRKSDFFKATAGHYGAMVKAGTPAATAMSLAANMAELDLMRSGKLAPDGGKGASREQERLARIAAQGGSAGPRRPSGAEEDDDTLSPEQKHVAAMMGISEEAYLKRAKAGVRMGGKQGR